MATLLQADGYNVIGKELRMIGLGTPVLIISLLAMMILPLPPFILDFLFTFNIALSLIILLASVYILRPLDFAVFPTVLLIATLVRLSLNVASTRVVLLKGHEGTGAAGGVIQAFGDFVVGGNYAVGLVVFAILVIINFVVVTKGAGRISEVAARFTLDAMPGKQMAIDADLSSGVIDQESARQRRDYVAREANFYGAMDGASKFVRGDAIAGILILCINIIGGFLIGVLQHDLSASQSAANYILLTIGDGLVAQIPSLLLSTAAALIVTRVNEAEDMGNQVMAQLFDSPKIFIITGTVIGSLGLVPGMPNLVFLVISCSLFSIAYYLSGRAATAVVEDDGAPEEPQPAGEKKELDWDDVVNTDIIGMELGYRLISLVDEKQGGDLLARIKGVRKKLSQDIGFLVQSVHVKDNLGLVPNAYRITLFDVPVSEGEIHPGMLMAIDSGNVFGDLDGISAKDPAFSLDTVWIEPGMREEAQSKGYTVVDCSTVIATHLSHTLKQHAHELLGHDEVQKLLDTLSRSAPKLVENLVPDTMSLGMVLKVMQNLLEEGIPIRDIRTIAEALAEHGKNGQNSDAMTQAVRTALGRTVCQNIIGTGPEMQVITFEPDMERLLLDSIVKPGSPGVIEPGLAQILVSEVKKKGRLVEMKGQAPVLLVSDGLRLWMARFLRNSYEGLKVLAYSEIPGNRKIKVVATVGQAGLQNTAA